MSPRDAQFHLMLYDVSVRTSAPQRFAARCPHESRLLDTSRLSVPLCHLYSTHTPLWPTLLSSCQDIAISQPHDTRIQILGPFLVRSRDTIPRIDPTVLLYSRSNSFPSLAPCILATWSSQYLNSQPANFRFREISQSLTTCPPQLNDYDPLAPSSPCILAPRDSEYPILGLSPCELPSS
jgi:hypothetical protein